MTRRSFRASKGSIPEARRFVSDGFGDLSAEVQDTVSVMVSELATNALLHASTGFDIEVERSVTEVTVSVTDSGDGTPTVQSPDSREPHGRGLRIVQSFADDWGVIPSSGGGKTVWFRLTIDDTPPGGSHHRQGATGSGDREGPARNLAPRRRAPRTPPDPESSSGPSAHLRSPRRFVRSRGTSTGAHRKLITDETRSTRR